MSAASSKMTAITGKMSFSLVLSPAARVVLTGSSEPVPDPVPDPPLFPPPAVGVTV